YDGCGDSKPQNATFRSVGLLKRNREQLFREQPGIQLPQEISAGFTGTDNQFWSGSSRNGLIRRKFTTLLLVLDPSLDIRFEYRMIKLKFKSICAFQKIRAAAE